MAGINFSLNIPMHEKALSAYIFNLEYSVKYRHLTTHGRLLPWDYFQDFCLFNNKTFWIQRRRLFGFMCFAINFVALRNLFQVRSNVLPSSRHGAPNKYRILPCCQEHFQQLWYFLPICSKIFVHNLQIFLAQWQVFCPQGYKLNCLFNPGKDPAKIISEKSKRFWLYAKLINDVALV